eukprot:CAMPEP_0179099730 /NCGR_PEP_ID=MMETSP0796-20121207/46023_1 /TAXON_ID=73915 /ORGANISM="Pyrodinium bahamense, Strain pbaha01" /LENGTH=306 /DNA_ID=CAMNT_0020797535 /DNA_START=80 /DNA_END=997 /DNA_ORIENTATION=+
MSATIRIGSERIQRLRETGLEGVALGCLAAAQALAEPGGDAAGVTHVVNASGAEYARCAGIEYLDLPLEDAEDADISQHCGACSDFIEAALGSHGLVLVHCKAGRSRSASLVAAWLMQRGRTLEEALEAVRRARPIAQPNPGFLQQLEALEARLRKRPPSTHDVLLDLGTLSDLHVPVPELYEVWCWEGNTDILPLKWSQAVEEGGAWDESMGPCPRVWEDPCFDRDGIFFVTHRSKAVGTVAALAGKSADEGVVQFLGVLPQERRKGLGRCLLRLALQRHGELGRRWVRATLPASAEGAVRLLRQ